MREEIDDFVAQSSTMTSMRNFPANDDLAF